MLYLFNYPQMYPNIDRAVLGGKSYYRVQVELKNRKEDHNGIGKEMKRPDIA